MRRSLPLLAVGALALTAPFVAACGGDDASSTAPTSGGGAAGSTVTVHAEKDALKFNNTAYSGKAGSVEIDYVNDGNVNHTLLLKDADGKKVSLGKGGKLTIGSKDSGTVDLAAGTYTLYCDLPGHEQAGMEATLTIR